MKAINVQDIYPASFRNQFGKTGAPVLNEAKTVYFVTAVRGTNWTMTVTGNSETFTRSGSGDTQFFIPVCGNSITFTGTTEVIGFYIKY